MEEKMAEKKWMGTTPVCDFTSYDKVCKMEPWFVDGKTKQGPWALMCSDHYLNLGIGLGCGKGQRYDGKTLLKLEG
jgi:hypothetical protein